MRWCTGIAATFTAAPPRVRCSAAAAATHLLGRWGVPGAPAGTPGRPARARVAILAPTKPSTRQKLAGRAAEAVHVMRSWKCTVCNERGAQAAHRQDGRRSPGWRPTQQSPQARSSSGSPVACRVAWQLIRLCFEVQGLQSSMLQRTAIAPAALAAPARPAVAQQRPRQHAAAARRQAGAPVQGRRLLVVQAVAGARGRAFELALIAASVGEGPAVFAGRGVRPRRALHLPLPAAAAAALLPMPSCALPHLLPAAPEKPAAKKKPAFPFTRLAGQEDMKLALLLNVVDPSIGATGGDNRQHSFRLLAGPFELLC